MEWSSDFRGWCETACDAREELGEQRDSGDGREQSERCLMISALPISIPKSGQTSGKVGE